MGSKESQTWLEKLEEQRNPPLTRPISIDTDEQGSQRRRRLDGPRIHQVHAHKAARPDEQPALGRHPARPPFQRRASSSNGKGVEGQRLVGNLHQNGNWTSVFHVFSIIGFLYTKSDILQAVLMCKKNIDLIQGRVLLQTLPSKAYDTQATLDHARLYDQEFARAGIGRDRYCIKIPSTGPALNAAKILSAEGIPTLGTALFGLPQAIACSQAGMLYISPYFNGLFRSPYPLISCGSEN